MAFSEVSTAFGITLTALSVVTITLFAPLPTLKKQKPERKAEALQSSGSV